MTQSINSERQRYRKRANQSVVAICLQLETPGFAYSKWGGEQRCKPGDWLVDNAGDVYSVDAEVFARTYRQVGPGQYVKITPVWAEQAAEAGSVTTKEGRSHYGASDYVVFNNADGTDAYCVSREKFEAMYEPDVGED
ncbi:MAG: hypothetical protein EHM62_02385 [Methylococcus sp.]|nr:MAG: hypothetical protein EHM62_02385 [Methylococcus sp.]